MLDIMPSPQVLQPVVKLKVDELYLTWLSDPSTQSVLKNYLSLIKSGQSIDLGNVDASDSVLFSENNNGSKGSLCHKTHADRRTTSLGASSSPPPSPTLPSGSSSNARVTGPNGRALRKSVSSKKVHLHKLYRLMNWVSVNISCLSWQRIHYIILLI